MAPVSCPPADLLRRALAGAVSGEEAESIAAHLETCAACTRAAAGLDSADGLTADLRAATGHPPAPDARGFIARLKQLWESQAPDRDPVERIAAEFLAPGEDDSLGLIGHYRVLRHLGSGGMGVVFAAEDLKLHRRVAIKVLSQPGAFRADLMHRERTLLAAMRHPHIVAVYDTGELKDGRLFIVMELVEGDTLDRYIAAQPPDVRQAVELLRDVAAAVGSAHALGIVHRDLKPQNVKVTAAGEVRVLDFGLAKRVTGLDSPGVEAGPDTTGVYGTRGFMSPEQARGEKVDARADVFALGTMLEQLLTKLRPRDLAAIAAKATAARAAERYADATALTADLDHWLAGRPVAARPCPAWERAWRWARRRPSEAALLFVSGLAILALPAAVIGALYSSRLSESLAETRQARDDEAIARQRAEDAERAVREAAYFHTIMLAGEAWRDAQVGRARELLAECDPGQRGWEWHYLSRVCDPPTTKLDHPGAVYAVAVSSDGARVASGCHDGTARVWDPKTGVGLHELRGHTERIYGLAFDPDGRRLVTASSDGTARVWDVQHGRELFVFKGHAGAVRSAVFSPDGRFIASTGKDARVKLWDPATGSVRLDLAGLAGQDHALKLSSDGRTLVYAGFGPVLLMDVESGAALQSLTGHVGIVRGVAFSPDGSKLVSVGEDGTGLIWTLKPKFDPKPQPLKGHVGKLYTVDWSPDGLSIATAGMDTAIKIWDPATGREVSHLQGHTGRVYSLAWGPDGRHLVTGSTDNTVRIWDASRHAGHRRLRAEGIPRALAWSPDGQRLYTTCERPSVLECWEHGTGRRCFSTPLSRSGTIAIVVSPDGRIVATAGSAQPVALWDADTGAALASLEAPAAVVQVVAFSPNGALLAAAARDRTMRFWNVAERREVARIEIGGEKPDLDWTVGERSIVRVMRSLPNEAQVNRGVAWSPDGRQLACGSIDSRVTIWNGDTGNVCAVLRGHTHGVNGLSWSADGRRLASASADRTVRVWDPIVAQQSLVLRGFLIDSLAVAWSPRGDHLAASSTDGTILIWDGTPVR